MHEIPVSWEFSHVPLRWRNQTWKGSGQMCSYCMYWLWWWDAAMGYKQKQEQAQIDSVSMPTLETPWRKI